MTKGERQIPEYLSDEDMQRFMSDVNFREARRAEQLGDRPIPSEGRVLRGYKRDWLYGEGPVLEAGDFSDAAAAAIQRGVQIVQRPFLDNITAGYDLYSPTEGAVRSYLRKPQTAYLGATALEEHSLQERRVIRQGAERMPKHIVDGLLRNTWINTRIADIRQAYIQHFMKSPGADWAPDDPTLAVVSDAVADLGYCMRYRLQADMKVDEKRLEPQEASRVFTVGLLMRASKWASEPLIYAPVRIEHIGLYAADGHPEMLQRNMGLIELVRHQQQVRRKHWGERFKVVIKVTGEQLSSTDAETEAGLVALLQKLYGLPPDHQSEEATER